MCNRNPQKCVPTEGSCGALQCRHAYTYNNNVLNPALPVRCSIAGRNNDGFSVRKRRGNMKGTRVKRYKCLFIFSYFRLCGRVHFFNHVPSRSIGFPAFFTLVWNVCIVRLYSIYILIIYLIFFFNVGQKYFSAYLFIIAFIYLYTYRLKRKL